jgi:hypothetical protein
MSHDDAVKMVESLVSAAMGAAMLDMPPLIALATYQRLEKEKLRVVSALVEPSDDVNRRARSTTRSEESCRAPG